MSTEYIERGALMNEIEKHFETIGANAQRLVARFPAADVAPVVRCKDCKYALCSCDGLVKYCLYWEGQYDTSDQLYHEPENFCSFGERKDKEENA